MSPIFKITYQVLLVITRIELVTPCIQDLKLSYAVYTLTIRNKKHRPVPNDSPKFLAFKKAALSRFNHVDISLRAADRNCCTQAIWKIQLLHFHWNEYQVKHSVEGVYKSRSKHKLAAFLTVACDSPDSQIFHSEQTFNYINLIVTVLE
jgi:hypothetical protein